MSIRVHRTFRGALVLIAVAVIGGVVHADAPVGQYLSFGPPAHCISDQKTHLTWTRTPITFPTGSSPTGNYADAAKACAGLAAGWRVPSVNELETLVDEIPHYEVEGGRLVQKAIDVYAFPRTPVGTAYWTSSVAPSPLSGTPHAWAVDFTYGITVPDAQSDPRLVRCVTEWTATGEAACPL